MGSLGLFTQNIIAMFSSFYIDALILKFGKRNVFLLSTVSFTICNDFCEVVTGQVGYRGDVRYLYSEVLKNGNSTILKTHLVTMIIALNKYYFYFMLSLITLFWK